MKAIILFIFCNLFLLSGYSQSQSPLNLDEKIDQLKVKLAATKVDTVKARLFVELAEFYTTVNFDSTLYFAEKALELSEKSEYVHGQLGALGFLGDCLISIGNLPKALEMGLKAIELGKNEPVRIAGVGPSYDNIGHIYHALEDYSNALKYYRLEVALGESDLMGVAYGNWNIATLMVDLNQLDSAMLYLDRSYRAFSRINYRTYPDVYHVYPRWYDTRARIYRKQNKPDLALADYKQSLGMTLNNSEFLPATDTYNEMALFYEELNEPDSVIFYGEKALSLAQSISYTKGILEASDLLARKYEAIDPAKALQFFKLAAENQNKLYGAGNIQAMRDMISQDEERKRELEAKEVAYQNRLRQYMLGLGLAAFLLISYILWRNNKKSKKINAELEQAFTTLKATQSQLIQSEKMASLGELTAGIAHEIQNPLNFVNNFSEVSKELLEEMKEELAEGNTQDVEELAGLLSQNLDRIHHHGGRASSIVKGMLQHSRAEKGKKEWVDINALADEYLRLAYHACLAGGQGVRGKDKLLSDGQAGFNVKMETAFDESIERIEVIPQEIGRVLLNLITNAFYAVNERKQQENDEYVPKVSVKTAQQNGQLMISVSDNGQGIPASIQDKIFQPFFTTKPTGQGTGLGLSLSYDIIKAHQGELRMDSEEGVGTSFTITLPKA